MYKFRAKLALFMALCIFLCSVNSMKVEATSVAVFGGMTAASLFEICLFVGGVALTCYAAGEIIENKDEIAAFGKNFLDSVTDIPKGWVMNMTDISGQEYVFGSEALELVQDTSWEVIQGGAPNDDDNNNDDNKKDWFNFASPANQLYASFTALGATWFADAAGKLYQKWVNGEELTETEQAALKPLIEAGVDQNDIKQQWSGEPFDYSATISDSYTTTSPVSQQTKFTVNSTFPLCGVYRTDSIWRYFEIYTISEYKTMISASMDKEFISYVDGKLIQHEFYEKRSSWSFPVTDSIKNFMMSYSVNFLVFSSRIEAEAYLKGTGAVTDALNYAHTYRNADWLSDDWKGLLIDPLTNIGLSLTQLIDLAKALGVHAVGNNFSAQDLAELLKQSLPAVNPDLMPDAEPVSPVVPNPDLLPIYYPSPTAHPLPGTDPDPGTNPGTNPGGTPDVTPGTDPEPEKLPAGDLVPTINDSLGDIAGNLKYKFPFSIPWDVRHVFQILADTPKAPRFELPLVIKRFGIDERIIVDMAMFQVLSNLSRSLFSMLFGMYLMNLTFKVVSMRKEE